MRTLLIGQAPSARSNPRHPLLGGRSGERLRLCAGLTLKEYVAAFERRNLFDVFPGEALHGDAFPKHEAYARAAAMTPWILARFGRVIFVGANVADAFGFVGDMFDWRSWIPPVIGARIPHPSGVNLWWNEPHNAKRVGAFLRAAAERRTAA